VFISQFTLHTFALALMADLGKVFFFGMQTQPIDKLGLPEFFFHPTGLEVLLYA
jgi:hypothetical protein